jgi:hypothetical protein
MNTDDQQSLYLQRAETEALKTTQPSMWRVEERRRADRNRAIIRDIDREIVKKVETANWRRGQWVRPARRLRKVFIVKAGRWGRDTFYIDQRRRLYKRWDDGAIFCTSPEEMVIHRGMGNVLLGALRNN